MNQPPSNLPPHLPPAYPQQQGYPPQGFGQVPGMPMPPRSGTGKKVAWGCGGCLTLLIIGGIATFFIVKNFLSDASKAYPYQQAVPAAQANAELKNALGEPIEVDAIIGRNVATNNGANKEDVTLKLKGPKGSAVLKAEGEKPSGGSWRMTRMAVELDAGGKKVNLMPATPAEAPPNP